MIDKNSIRSVDRTIDVLGTFIGATGSLKVSEIEAATGINLPTLYRIMNTLERRHFIRPAADPTRYELDYGIVEIASGWLRNQDVVGRIEPLMQELAETTKETVAFNLYRDRQRICVREIPSQQAINFTRGIGTTESLLYGASGKAILAFESDQKQIDLVGKISKSKRNNYLQELTAIRKNGFATSESELIEGATSIAAPVWDISGAILGTVGIYGPTNRITKNKMQLFKKQILSSSQRMSTVMGYSGT
jgi:DNA-binding IclR family transcriptional regulator